MAIDLQRDLGHVQVNKNSVKHAKPRPRPLPSDSFWYLYKYSSQLRLMSISGHSCSRTQLLTEAQLILLRPVTFSCYIPNAQSAIMTR